MLSKIHIYTISLDFEVSEMCSLLNKLALAIKRENLSVIRDENKKETILKTVFKLINITTDDELTVHILLVLLQVNFYRSILSID